MLNKYVDAYKSLEKTRRNTDNYVAVAVAVDMYHIVVMGYVILEKVVHHVRVTAGRVHHRQCIAEMEHVITGKVVHHALGIVEHVKYHHVGMVIVTMEKIVIHVQVIVLERIHVTIVLRRIGKWLRG